MDKTTNIPSYKLKQNRKILIEITLYMPKTTNIITASFSIFVAYFLYPAQKKC